MSLLSTRIRIHNSQIRSLVFGSLTIPTQRISHRHLHYRYPPPSLPQSQSQTRSLSITMTPPNPSTKSLYDAKTFRSHSNTPNGEVSALTTFTYHQRDSLVWAEYSGGSIVKGFLIATVQQDQSLDARYQHVNEKGELMTGKCRSVPVLLEDGRVRLNERWRWTCGEESEGKSVVEEVREGGS